MVVSTSYPGSEVAARGASAIELSVVIPVYNEAENLRELHRRLTAALEPLALEYEILLVDDHSRDETPRIILELATADRRVRSLRFSRNFGHQMALSAGLRYARGEIVVMMDGDLQDPPEVLPDLLRKIRDEDWDVVYAIRRRRKESLVYRTLYKGFYRILSRMSYIDIPVDAGDFCAMRRCVADALNALPECNRFLRGLRAWVGFRQTGLEYERQARHAGEAKYTLAALLRLAFDGIFTFSYVPLRVAMWFGFVISSLGLLYAVYLVWARLVHHSFTGVLTGWTTLVVAVMVLGGLQMMLIGIVGEYIGRIFEETKRRPPYIVHRFVNFEDEAR
ncbi:MAG TPA: glycosyltransferase family 2 protein [Candidatus Sumerlaeota bacterium]|nr:glycosyltransferase family 2 protein [Candidatus Sumerlaeota bacterium]HOR28525.1 glycosyltransferase family 2 protein [Candidatus Sumerlaeota bacterium]HPK02653.1 glycosyltransferase family 2 protein [Candidatus Sumerlaeota bacterium]